MARARRCKKSTKIDDGGSEIDYSGEHEKDPGIGETEGPLFDLGRALAAEDSEPSEFSFGGSADFLPAAPGLFIEGVGKVVLPLIDEQQADKIVKICEPTPSEPELDTIVDTSMHSSWQLDSSKVKLQNPGWTSGIHKTLPLIAKKFGVTGTPINLHLHKLLLYKEGGHHAKHRDTEREDRSFATMVVQLPSAHKGGQLQVFKDSSEDPITHNFGAEAGTAEYQCNYAIHYADVEYAVQPVTEGYRIALVYSVCWPADSTQPAPSLSGDSQAPMLKALAELADANRDFHYYFKYSYTLNSITKLGASALKRQDRARFANLCTVNATLPAHQRFDFYLVRGQRHVSYHGEGQALEDCDWQATDAPSHTFTPMISLEGRHLTASRIQLNDTDALNPEELTLLQRWRGRESTFERYISDFGPAKDTTCEKFLLLAWPTKLTEDKMLALAGIHIHFSLMLSTGASTAAVRKFVQRVLRMKAEGKFKQDEEIQFGQALYTFIDSERSLYDLFPLYFTLYPQGTHVPKSIAPSYLADMYGMTPAADTKTPFIDIIKLAKHARLWECCGEKIVRAFEGESNIIPTLDLMEEVRKSTVLPTETMDKLIKQFLGLFRQPVATTTDPDLCEDEALQQKLWSAVLVNERSESFEDLARTYVAYFPQGGYAETELENTERFKDLLRLATSTKTWKMISPTVLNAFEGDVEGALVFVQLCNERSLPRAVWNPFLDIALKFCEAPKKKAVSPPAPRRPVIHDDCSELSESPEGSEESDSSKVFDGPNVAKSDLLKAMWNVAMMLDAKKEGSRPYADAVAQLLKRYITMAPMGIAAVATKEYDVEEDFSDLIQLACKFPTVWKASKSQVFGALRSDMKRSIMFISKCRIANLPQTVWGPIVDICASVHTRPAHKELSDLTFQAALWRLAIDLPAPSLCQASVNRYIEISSSKGTAACTALTAECKTDLRAFQRQRTVLEPLLLHWLHAETKRWDSIAPTITGIDSNDALAAFVESSIMTTRFGNFGSITEARKWAAEITFKNCSITAEPDGRGQDSFVLITKDAKCFKEIEAKRKVIKTR
ncbi:unnamed protein product [Tilletia caries]|uniref:Fe2OG dioxygenase domain-containing protein n=1 Tax=Tilletia caries TaxID=13290 RepID=A0ABN7IPI0_9BASI|nr:unnamed protein product [Tilletia caries]CAD6900764.1 unnamed protein product [Tilletia caries]CAD6975528.1 unnamed protein product [Tilletia controversa]